MFEDNLEVKLRTILTDEAAEVGRVREEKGRRKKSREEKKSEEKNSRRAKGRKIAKHLHCVFPECVARVPVSLWGSEG